MSSQSLTESQRELLQRWFDGELAEGERRRAEDLLQSSEAADSYIEALEEIRSAATIAFDTSLEAVSQELSSANLVEAAIDAPPLEDLPLLELAPVLERYHDGEVTEAERRTIEKLRRKRTDVADYLEHLAFVGETVRAANEEAAQKVDLDSVWSGVERDLTYEDAEEAPDYRAERDQSLIHRYVDDELDEWRSEQVQEWLDDDSEAADTARQIEKLGDATRIAFEEAGADVDLDGMWSEVASRLDADDTEETDDADVVSIDRARDDGGAQAAGSEADEASGGKVVGLFSQYGQALVGAAAATLLVLGAIALFGDKLFPGQTVVKEKTVVIVDSVEYESGSSVVVDSPMKQVRAKSQKESKDDEDDKDEKPTVIWLLDSNGDSDSEKGESKPAEAPSKGTKGGPDAGSDQDTEDEDTTEKRGQPI